MNKLLRLLLALSSVLGAMPLAAQTPSAAAASAPIFAVRAEVATALQQTVELHRGGKLADALARIEQAIATTTTPQPAEATVLQRTRGLLLLQLDKPAEAVKSLEQALAVNAMPAADQLLCEEAMVRASYMLKNYKGTLEWAAKAQAHGSTWGGLQQLVPRAQYLTEDFAGTAKTLEAQAERGVKQGEDELRLLASSYGKIKNEAGYTRVIERLLRDHPRADYWPDLLARVPRQPGWQARWDIDLMRLRLQTEQMDEANDYLALADMAARVGLPAEAQKVMDAGYAKGMLGKGSGATEQAKLRSSVTKQADDDRANLAATGARNPTVTDARSATSAFNTGAALVSIGQFERGLEWMKAALAGPLPDAAQGRLQYGLALQRAGRGAEATEALNAVASHEGLGLLARLWLIALNPKKS